MSVFMNDNTSDLAYGKRGMAGVLVPQANTTVEPEFAVLMPPSTGFLAARMTSARETIAHRLVDYFDAIPEHVTQFANAPVDAYAFATTGASYLVGPTREDEMVARIGNETGKPLVTTGLAVCEMLRQLDATKIGLVSPYPDDLTDLSQDYWKARDYNVVARVSAYETSDSFHPIYSMAGARAAKAYESADFSECDAVIMLGTGMPTLHALAAHEHSSPPVLSCMLALVWATANALLETPHDDAQKWLSGQHWHARLEQAHPM